MKILIAYDINHRHPEVKQALLNEGFKDFWETTAGTIHYLPNTTLWHPDLTGPTQTQRIFFRIIDNLNIGKPQNNIITVSHFVAIEMGVISGVEGEPHA